VASLRRPAPQSEMQFVQGLDLLEVLGYFEIKRGNSLMITELKGMILNEE
jgi:hypothetical protein